MWGILLSSLGTFFEEISSLLGKARIQRQTQNIYVMGFLQMLGVALAFGILTAINPGQFVFSRASLPTFMVRAILEILQAHYTMVSIATADRSTYGFLRTGTIPLLLLVDLALGYTITFRQISGILLIAAALVFLFANHGIGRKGIGATLFTTFNAVVTISLYKYDITNFNSIIAEQFIIVSIVLLYFALRGWLTNKLHPVLFIKNPAFLIQSLTQGIAGIFDSFAYGFAPASIILSVKRSSAIIWSILSGNRFFGEKNFALKFTGSIAVIIGIGLLI